MQPPGGILEMTRDTLVRARFAVSKCLKLTCRLVFTYQCNDNILAHLKLLWFNSAAKHYFPT